MGLQGVGFTPPFTLVATLLSHVLPQLFILAQELMTDGAVLLERLAQVSLTSLVMRALVDAYLFLLHLTMGKTGGGMVDEVG